MERSVCQSLRLDMGEKWYSWSHACCCWHACISPDRPPRPVKIAGGSRDIPFFPLLPTPFLPPPPPRKRRAVDRVKQCTTSLVPDFFLFSSPSCVVPYAQPEVAYARVRMRTARQSTFLPREGSLQNLCHYCFRYLMPVGPFSFFGKLPATFLSHRKRLGKGSAQRVQMCVFTTKETSPIALSFSLFLARNPLAFLSLFLLGLVAARQDTNGFACSTCGFP